MTYRQRLSATVEADVLSAAKRAVAEGRAGSLSAWVNEALKRQAEHDRRIKALGQFIRDYEAEHGAITDDEMRAARRHFRARAVAVRPGAPGARRSGPRPKPGAA